MAFIHGKKTGFKIDNSGGTLTDISAYVNEASLSRSIETAEVTVFGNSAKQYITGLSDGTISISGSFDSASASTVDGVLSGILGQDATVTFELIPNNATAVSATNPKYTGESIMTSYEVSASVGEAVTFSAEFQCTGTITRATA